MTLGSPNRLALAAFCAAAAFQTTPARADDAQPSLVKKTDVQVSVVAAGPYNVSVVTWKDRPFLTVVHQRYDFSCGSAALATLLRYQYGRDVDENQIFKDMWAVGDHDAIGKHGFSLADMKRYLATRGMGSDGYRVPLERYAQAKVPGIAVIRVGGYKHFVVIKSVRDGEVLVGDPATGLHAYTEADFQNMWDGLIFVIHDEAHPNDHHGFDSDHEWAQLSATPLELATRPGEVFPTMQMLEAGTYFQILPPNVASKF
jgi:predicted double-glycine peptidase